jgi:multifunctional methyltransferase subunit TRM112
MGIPTLPPALSQELADDPEFLKALYHILMNVHLEQGMVSFGDDDDEFNK